MSSTVLSPRNEWNNLLQFHMLQAYLSQQERFLQHRDRLAEQLPSTKSFGSLDLAALLLDCRFHATG